MVIFMLRLVMRFSWIGCLALSLQSSWGFALLGPINEAYQVATIGYALPGDLGAPKNLGEEYRRNTPVMYYAFDANFLDYFGNSGASAIDAACGAYNSLTNVSGYSSDLSEVPLSATRQNYRATALQLNDLKSTTMHLLAEQLGLAPPERYVWCLHDRFNIPGTTCPAGMEYLVIQRNFDPVMSSLDQFQTSSYVNGARYSYWIQEICSGPNPLAEAYEFSVDPLDISFSSIAGWGDYSGNASAGQLLSGRYFTGLTRDDVGGLRYMLRTNNLNYESAGPNAFTLVTNRTAQLLFTLDLNQLAAAALTNDAAALAALYPGLVSVSSNYFQNVRTTNLFAYLTNYPWDFAGSPATLVVGSNVTVSVGTFYAHNFLNVVVPTNTPTGWTYVPLTTIPRPTSTLVSVLTATVGTQNNPWGPVGSVTVTTNFSLVNYYTNMVKGDFFILSGNQCDVALIRSQLTNTIYTTNLLFSATNAAASTNTIGTLEVDESLVTAFRQRVFVTYPIDCASDNVALEQGVERISFVRHDYDSLLGRYYAPITNYYTLNAVTNSSLVPQRVFRVVTTPDILFSAEDLPLTPGPDGDPANLFIFDRNVNFNSTLANPALAGPGTIDTPTVVHFNKVGPVYFNYSPNAYFMDSAEAGQFNYWIWGSFDGSTNPPVVFPNGTSITTVENQVLIQIYPNSLTTASVGHAYSLQFAATGGVAPLTWTLAPGSAGLPSGLSLSSSGLLSGTPAHSGTFDFTVRLTDAGGRTVDRGCALTINP